MKSLRQDINDKKLKEFTTLKPVYIQGYENLGYKQIQDIIKHYLKSRTGIKTTSFQTSIKTIPDKSSVVIDGISEILTPPTGNLMHSGTPEGKPVPRHSVNNSHQDKNKYPPFDDSEPSPMVVYIILYIISIIISATINKSRYFNKHTGYVYISTDKFLVKIFGHAHQVDKALDYAVGSGILMKLAREPMKYPAQYKVNPKFLPLNGDAKVVTFQIHNLEAARQIQRYWSEQKINENRDTVTLAAEDIVRSLQIQSKNAKEFIERSYQKEWDSIRHNYIRECTVGLALMKADFTIAHPKSNEQIVRVVNLESDDVAFYPKRCRVGRILKKITINPTQIGIRFKRPIRLKKDQRLRLLDKRSAAHYFVEQLTHKPNNPLCRRDKYGGRMTTPLTKSPKSLRQFLSFKYNKEDLYLIDLSNAQPLLMVIPMMEHFQRQLGVEPAEITQSVPQFVSLLHSRQHYGDVAEYIRFVQSNTFYGQVYSWLVNSTFNILIDFIDKADLFITTPYKPVSSTHTMAVTLYQNKKPLQNILKFIPDFDLTGDLTERLKQLRKTTLTRPNIIDETFLEKLIVAADTARIVPMNPSWQKKIKKLCAHYIYYGLPWGQPLLDKQDKVIFDYEGKPIYKKYNEPIEAVFKREFPNVARFIDGIKKTEGIGYRALAKILQGLESKIFIDTVLNQLTVVQGKRNILSLHDGIVCTRQDVEMVIIEIEKAFKQWNLQVPIKIENLSDPNKPVQTRILNRPYPTNALLESPSIQMPSVRQVA